MVASVPQRRFGCSGMIVPSWSRGRRRPRVRWVPAGREPGAAAAPACRSPGRHAGGAAGPGPCGRPRRRTASQPAPDGSAAPAPRRLSSALDRGGLAGRQHGGGHRPWSGARPAPGTPPCGAGCAPWLSGPLRRRDLEPPFFGGRPQHLMLEVELADLAFGLLQRPVIRRLDDPLALEPCLPAARKSSRQAANRCALTFSSRDSSSKGSPRSNLSTASVFFPADQRGPDPESLPCSLGLFTDMRVIFTLVYPVSNPTGSDGLVSPAWLFSCGLWKDRGNDL